MRKKRYLRWAMVLTFLFGMRAMKAQQNEAQLRERLVRQPLYLRGFWMGRELEFDGAGHLMGDPRKDGNVEGPVTLSGVDVTGVSVKGAVLTVHGERVALVADARGRLGRTGLFSTTSLVGTMLHRRYKGKEEVKIIVRADQAGSFDPALKAVFANGLVELATSMPPYWSCYAQGYFAKDVPDVEAERIVNDCVQRDTPSDGADSSPEMTHAVQPQGTREAAELGVSGESRVHIVVTGRGVPTRFQVVRAVGAGLDESTLQALAQSTFAPATKDGVPVAAGLKFGIDYGAETAR
jgi:hypothetical protein